MFQVMQENGTILFSEQSKYGSLSEIPGLPARIMVSKYIAPGQLSTVIYDAKTFEHIHTFPFSVFKTTPDGQKEYYWRLTKDSNVTTVHIYDGENYSVKSIALDSTLSNLQLVRNHFSNSGKLEIFYTTKPNGNNQNNKALCKDEDGNLLFSFEGGISANIDRQAGMADKLFVLYTDSTQVYGFTPLNTAVPNLPELQTLKAFPNPFSRSFELTFPQSDAFTFELINVLGERISLQTVYNTNKTIVQVPEHIPGGTYFLRTYNA